MPTQDRLESVPITLHELFSGDTNSLSLSDLLYGIERISTAYGRILILFLMDNMMFASLVR